jgi:hypothetical protein
MAGDHVGVRYVGFVCRNQVLRKTLRSSAAVITVNPSGSAFTRTLLSAGRKKLGFLDG